MVIVKYEDEFLIPKNFTGIDYFGGFILSKVFRKNKLVHRYYGPAAFYKDGYKSWWINDKFYGSNINNYSQKKIFKRSKQVMVNVKN